MEVVHPLACKNQLSIIPLGDPKGTHLLMRGHHVEHVGYSYKEACDRYEGILGELDHDREMESESTFC